jgi:hypothetical protein
MVGRDLLQVSPKVLIQTKKEFDLDFNKFMPKSTAKNLKSDFADIIYQSRVQHAFSEIIRKAQTVQL